MKKIHYRKNKFNTIYTIFVFVALASLDNAVIGLFPPLFSSIAKDFKIHISSFGVISAINMLVTSISSIFWGYAADKGERKKLIIVGTIIWSISVFMTSRSQSYLQLMIYQILTGIGLGCIASIGFSVLTDYFPKNLRGMLMSLWGLSQGFGGIAGSVMASLIAPAFGWRKPFEVIAILGTVFIFLYFFIKEPSKGAAEPELKSLEKAGIKYDYSIQYSHISEMLKKKSNQWLIFQGFFMNITTGTLIWLPTLYIAKIEAFGYSSQTSLITAGYLFALLQTGGLASIYFGYIGDKIQKHTSGGRALLASFAIFIAVPLYIGMFAVPIKSLSIPDNGNPILILMGIFKEISINPLFLLMFILAILATAAQSVNTPNWLTLITEVNLPEHRGTLFSIANLVNGVGRSIGNILIGIVLRYVTTTFHAYEPNNYIITMAFFQLFFLPSAYCYIVISKRYKIDAGDVRSLLKKRAEDK